MSETLTVPAATERRLFKIPGRILGVRGHVLVSVRSFLGLDPELVCESNGHSLYPPTADYTIRAYRLAEFYCERADCTLVFPRF